MKRRFALLATLALAVVLVVALVPSSVSHAGSQDTYVKITALTSWSCTPGNAANITFDYSVDAGDTSSHNWSLTNLNTGTASTATAGPMAGPALNIGVNTGLLVPPGTTAGDILEYKIIATSVLYDGSITTVKFNCSTGAVLAMTFDFLPLGYQGVPVPDDFVLRSITCDTAAYSSAGGGEVEGAVVTAGQTWFVNPTSVTGADGASWTEIFLAGENTAFIPTACVGAAP